MSWIPPELITVAAEASTLSCGVVQTNDDVDRLAAKKKELVAAKNELEKQRKEAKKPHLDAGREIDNEAKVIADPIKQAIDQIDKSLSEYRMQIESERARIRAEQALKSLERRQEHKETGIPAEVDPVFMPESANVRTRKYKSLVYDKMEIIKAQLWDYLMVDEVKLRKALLDGTLSVPSHVASLKEEERIA